MDMVLLPGMVIVFNRMPKDFEFQYDSKPYTLPTGKRCAVPFAIAEMAVRRGVIMYDQEGTAVPGVVALEEHWPDPPMVPAEDMPDDQIAHDRVEVPQGMNLYKWNVKINQPAQTRPVRRSGEPGPINMLVGTG